MMLFVRNRGFFESQCHKLLRFIFQHLKVQFLHFVLYLLKAGDDFKLVLGLGALGSQHLGRPENLFGFRT